MLKLSKFWPSQALNQMLILFKTQTWITILKIFQFSFETFLFSIWCSCLDSNIQQIGCGEWGWIKDERNIKPRWTTMPQVSKACQELISCECQKQCSSRCKCIKSGLNCTQLCVCEGGCYKNYKFLAVYK